MYGYYTEDKLNRDESWSNIDEAAEELEQLSKHKSDYKLVW